MTSRDDFGAFDEQAAQLEAHIAEAESRGEEVPPEARAILASLRELARAVEGLRESLVQDPPADAAEAVDEGGPAAG